MLKEQESRATRFSFMVFIVRFARSVRSLSLCGLGLMSLPGWAQQIQVDACDLNSDGVVNSADVTLAVNMTLGLATCTADIIGIGVCNAVVVQRVTNAALGGSCVAGNPHTVTLNWTASVSPNLISYNIYRGTVSGGPYVKIASVASSLVTYTDTTSLAGESYYYVVTAVDANNNESSYSNQAQANVAFP